MIGLSHVFFVGEELSTDTRSKAAPAERRELPRTLSGRLPCTHSHRNKTPEALSCLLRFVLEESGLEAANYQARALNRRLPACLRALRAPSEAAALEALKGNPGLLPTALNSLLVGVSGFFRDPAVFEHLGQETLPKMLNRTGGLRVYSVGCSTGEELYSAGMLLDELGALEVSRLWGVDCRAEAIAHARAGWVDTAQLQELRSQRWGRYFEIEGKRARLTRRLRESLQWRKSDLQVRLADAPWDLILFRNVAIYLVADAAEAVWRCLEEQLRPGGMLVTGKAERPPVWLGLRQEGGCVYRKPERES